MELSVFRLFYSLPIISETVSLGGFRSSAIILISKVVSANSLFDDTSVALTVILYSLALVLEKKSNDEIFVYYKQNCHFLQNLCFCEVITFKN